MKLMNKHDLPYMLKGLAQLQGFVPVLMVIVTVFSLMLAVDSVKAYINEQQEAKQASAMPAFEIKKVNVGNKAYERYAEVLDRISPEVKVLGGKEGLVISAEKAEAYPEFMHVLNSVQGLSERVIWQADDICLMKCEGGVMKAVIKGLQEEIEVKLRG